MDHLYSSHIIKRTFPNDHLPFSFRTSFLIIGAKILVRGASRVATGVGISPLIIGLTVVAFGTSSPELAVSIKSALPGQADIALGNVVGSNIFNILGVLGLAGIFAPSGIEVSEGIYHFDISVMIAVAFACLPIFLPGVRSKDGREHCCLDIT